MKHISFSNPFRSTASVIDNILGCKRKKFAAFVLWYKAKCVFFYHALKEGEIPTEVASCKGKIEGSKLYKIAGIGSGGSKAVWSMAWESRIKSDLL